MLGRALGHGRAGHLSDECDRLVKRRADDGPHQPPLALVAVDPRRQSELSIERVDSLVPRRRVAHSGDADLAEQREDGARVAALVAQPHRALGQLGDDRLPDIAITARVDVRLQQNAQKLAAAGLCATLEIRQRKPGFTGLGQEPLELPERLNTTGPIKRRAHAPHGRQI